ncbi:MAG: tRNA (adenosine(37)-N6)-dimethylallyltransferase MiaA [Alphaproteobacteria bacterium]|nr:tRNA (adenosine(37)-N6)-dimethylallyltransferase MiaA [Alphaproteobacteria bacterium]
MTKHDVIVLFGPTASGKSALALKLAKEHNGAIINADSIQLFDDLSILTARPLPQDTENIPHHLYGILKPDHQPNAGWWLSKVEACIQSCWDQGQMPILVGGTGLYLTTFLKGIADIPSISSDIMNKVDNLYSQSNDFYQDVIKHDPNLEGAYHPNDHKRLKRALCVFMQTQHSILDFYAAQKPSHWAQKARTIYLKPQRELLYINIENRLEDMLKRGAIEQVSQFMQSHNAPLTLPVFQAIGAREIYDYLKGDLDYDHMKRRIIEKTRQYAKRQYTWFNNQMQPDSTLCAYE